jgi:hypothetical protein
MSYADNLENTLKALESQEQPDISEKRRLRAESDAARTHARAAAPYAEELKNGQFTQELLSAAVRIGHGLRTKVQMTWLDTKLRLQAREHRLEIRPTTNGAAATFFDGKGQTREEVVDLSGSGQALAERWLKMVGPRPVVEPAPDFD